MSRIEQLEQRLAVDPNSRMFVQLAEEYRKAGLLDDAIGVCEEGLKKHPDYPSAQVALGRALLEAESYDRAGEQFEAVLAKIPDNILANKFLGETYHRLGRYEEAIQKYQVVQTLAPEDTELEERIQAVRDELAGGGPAAAAPPALPAPAGGLASSPPVPTQPMVPPVPSPASHNEPTLEPTLVEAPAAHNEPVLEPTLFEAPAAPNEPTLVDAPAPVAQEEPDELAPIPLVAVDEPMVLEERSYNAAYVPPAVEASDGAGLDDLPPVPLVAEAEAFEVVHSGQAVDQAPREPEPELVESSPPSPPPPVAPDPHPEVPEPTRVEPEPEMFVSPDQVQEAGPETPTMAEIYASQGHFEQAMTVYRNLLARNPQATQYQDRIEELSILAQAAADVPGASLAAAPASPRSELPSESRQKTIGVLEQWLVAIRKSRGA